MGTIYLVRHGEAAATWERDRDPGLSERGRAQARAVAEHFNSTEVEQIFSSPLLRARETAEPLGSAKQRLVRIDDAFREIPTPVNIPISERLDWLRSCANQSWESASQMVLDWRQAILQSLGQLPDHSVVFTHFMVMNAVLGQAQGQSQIVCYQPDYCSVLTLRTGGQALQVAELGRQSESRIL